jgi:hypothetical protein
MRREHERLEVRHGDHDETAATVANRRIDLIEVADEKLLLLRAFRV